MTPSLHGLSVIGLAGQAESGIGTPVLGTTHFTFRVCLSGIDALVIGTMHVTFRVCFPPWQVLEHW